MILMDEVIENEFQCQIIKKIRYNTKKKQYRNLPENTKASSQPIALTTKPGKKYKN